MALIAGLALLAAACSGDDVAVRPAPRSTTTSEPARPTTTAAASTTTVATTTSAAPPTSTTTAAAPPTTAAPATATPPTTRPASPATTRPAAPATAPTPNGIAGAVIVVDPGHNGANGAHPAEIGRLVDAGGRMKPCNTTGTAEGGYTEARFTWEVALRLAERLRALGATVILTRTSNDGWGPCVDERGLTAQRNGAALLISLHADGAGAGDHGFHVIHPGVVKGYTDAIAAPSDRLATTARDALVAAGFAPANYIGADGLDRRTDLGTLNRAGVPAIMVESGNMHDPGDLAVLRSADGQDRLAAALAAAASTYLGG